MTHKSNPKIALLGNPNSGKSSLFNHLTGLNQKVGNFPGVTVDKKTGKARLNDYITADIIDLPGTYSLYPRSADEEIVFSYLSDKSASDYPDLLLVVADASNLKRNLFLFTQVYDLGIPLILVLTMTDQAEEAGLRLDIEKLKSILKVPVVAINARTGKNIFRLKELIINPPLATGHQTFDVDALAPELIPAIKEEFKISRSYQALQLAHQYKNLTYLNHKEKVKLGALVEKFAFNSQAMQVSETMNRYARIDEIVNASLTGNARETISNKIDQLLTHRIWGYLIFFLMLFTMFQAIFSWSSYPMDLIDAGVAGLNDLAKNKLPEGPFTDLLTEGIISGLGGILIFIPQIAILFAFIAVLEESGYMARVMFIMDRFMRKFGMNGKSVVPLISGVACAVPAVMAARSIENRKERLITIFVTPFMSCSARIPVYTVLIALVIPSVSVLGIFNLQGLVLMGLYLAGFMMAIFTGGVMNGFLNIKGRKSFFILELPSYKMPRWKNVVITIFEKVRSFVFEAGKIILAISVVLWVLASFGPAGKMEESGRVVYDQAILAGKTESEATNLAASVALENSYAGHFGKFIEPAIRPLGFDWKIGVALFTSFAAREVFVGTMATIYSIGADAESTSVRERMKKEINPSTGKPFYALPLGLSLLIFYAFAMQCMSTLAVVYRETGGWRWPIYQFLYMTSVAYLFSLTVYQVFEIFF